MVLRLEPCLLGLDESGFGVATLDPVIGASHRGQCRAGRWMARSKYRLFDRAGCDCGALPCHVPRKPLLGMEERLQIEEMSLDDSRIILPDGGAQLVAGACISDFAAMT